MTDRVLAPWLTLMKSPPLKLINMSYLTDILFVKFPLLFEVIFIHKKICLSEKEIPHFAKPSQARDLTSFGMTMQFLWKEEEAAIRISFYI